MDKTSVHLKTEGDRNYNCLITWTIRNLSSIRNLEPNPFYLENEAFAVTLLKSEYELNIRVRSTNRSLKCAFSAYNFSGTLLFSTTISETKGVTLFDSIYKHDIFGNVFKFDNRYWYEYTLIHSTDKEVSYQKLKKLPEDSLVLIFKIKPLVADTMCIGNRPIDTPTMTVKYLRILGDALQNTDCAMSSEKVLLRVGEETESVSKVVLCATSPVFAKMFETEMKEMLENAVTITDIKMPVIKALVSFLYSGKLSNRDFDFLINLHYAAAKYDISELREACVDFMLPLISMDNVFEALKLAVIHNDKRLKSVAMTFISANIETVATTTDWRNLIDEEPQIAVEVLNFLNF